MTRARDIDHILEHLRKAREAFYERNRVATAIHLTNAMNIDPNSEHVTNFVNEMEKELLDIDDELVEKGEQEFQEFHQFLEKIRAINTTLRDKGAAEEEAFRYVAAKDAGLSSGYFADEISSSDRFVLKSFKRKPTYDRQDEGERTDSVRELIASDLYQLFLYDRVSTVALVQSKNPDQVRLYVRSKFLPNDVQTLGDYVDNQGIPGLINICGFEQIMAALDLLGEADGHPGNLMVRKSQEQQGKFELLKIDHGRSLSRFPKTFENYVSNILTIESERFRNLYKESVKYGALTFNLGDYCSSLQQMLSTLDDDIIDAIVNKKIDALKKLGFEPSNPFFLKVFSTIERVIEDTLQSRYKGLEEAGFTPEKIMKKIEKQMTLGFDDEFIHKITEALKKSKISDEIVDIIAKELRDQGFHGYVDAIINTLTSVGVSDNIDEKFETMRKRYTWVLTNHFERMRCYADMIEEIYNLSQGIIDPEERSLFENKDWIEMLSNNGFDALTNTLRLGQKRDSKMMLESIPEEDEEEIKEMLDVRPSVLKMQPEITFQSGWFRQLGIVPERDPVQVSESDGVDISSNVSFRTRKYLESV